MDVEMCPCGQPLHYVRKDSELYVKEMIKLHGYMVKVHTGNRVFEVPRHWIALHGLAAQELPKLAKKYGWREV